MPRRNDIHSILIIGAGPIVIGQACEFDYSGAEACGSMYTASAVSGSVMMVAGLEFTRMTR